MTITDELKQNAAISDPYVKNMQVVVIKADKAGEFKDTASLADKTVVAEAGSAGEKVIGEDENLSKANYISVTKQTDALLEIKAGTADAAVLDWTLAKSMIGEGTDYADLVMIDGVELSLEEYGIGFRKDSDLCTEVNKIMKEMKEDGTLQALADKYGLGLAE
jgi:polar amino acid transport system substrate-binding protein